MEEVLGIYSQACRFLRLPHHIHSSYEKSIIERTMQYIKKIEPNALIMTISLAERRIVNYYMCGIG
jgi:hypothetical protein